MMRRTFLALALLALVAADAVAATPPQPAYKVVVHPSNPAAALTRQQVSALFLKRTGTWGHGGRVLPVDLEERSPVRAAFTRDVHGRSVADVVRYWQERVFAGRAVPPAEKASDEEVVRFVEALPGAVGYVSASASTGRARVVAVR